MAEQDSANIDDYHMILFDSLKELSEEVGDETDEVLVALILWERFSLTKQGAEEIESGNLTAGGISSRSTVKSHSGCTL